MGVAFVPWGLACGESFVVPGFEFRVSGLRFRFSGFGFRISGLWFQVLGFGFWISGFVCRGYLDVSVTGVNRSSETSTPLGPRYGPSQRPTAESEEKVVSYERGTPVGQCPVRVLAEFVIAEVHVVQHLSHHELSKVDQIEVLPRATCPRNWSTPGRARAKTDRAASWIWYTLQGSWSRV